MDLFASEWPEPRRLVRVIAGELGSLQGEGAVLLEDGAADWLDAFAVPVFFGTGDWPQGLFSADDAFARTDSESHGTALPQSGGAPVPPPLLAPAARGLSAPRPTERISARIAARDMLPVGGGAPLTNMPPAPAQPAPEPSADGADAALAAIDDAAAAPVAGPPVDV